MITQQTATDIAVLYRDIQAAEELLAQVKAAIDKFDQIDIRDVFGRRRHALELGIPSGDNARRILQVPYKLAVPVIEATIASHRARLKALDTKARAELAGEPAEAEAQPEPDYVTIGGLKVEVVSAEVAEQVTYVVCAQATDPSPFADNVQTMCGMCGAAIIHRPHAPAAPMKICVPCMVVRSEAEEGLN